MCVCVRCVSDACVCVCVLIISSERENVLLRLDIAARPAQRVLCAADFRRISPLRCRPHTTPSHNTLSEDGAGDPIGLVLAMHRTRSSREESLSPRRQYAENAVSARRRLLLGR